MGRPKQKKFVNNLDMGSTAITTSQTSPDVLQIGFPLGDVLYKSLSLRFDGTLSLTTSGAGTIITRGGLQFIRYLKLETDKHGQIIESLDGIMLHVMQSVRRHARPLNTDISSAGSGTPTWEYHLDFDFGDPQMIREEDTYLDMLNARPTMTLQLGVVSDFISGGTYSVESVNAARREVSCAVDPGPIDVSQDGPIMMPHYGIRKEPITATTKKYQIILPYGDRIYKRIYITQRNSSTFAEINNTILGANNNDRLDLKLNGYSWVDNREWIELQDQNAGDYEITMPTGVGVLDFVPRRAQGAKLSDCLSVVSNVQGVLELDIDVTTVTNGQLWLGYESVKPLPPAAVRPAPVAAK